MSDCPNTECADHVQELLEEVAMLKKQLRATEKLRQGESVVNNELLKQLADLSESRCQRCGIATPPGMIHSCH